MGSQSLYRKWRSQTFGDLVGQEAVTQTLQNALRTGRITHAYLFCGPRGTGKTSTARLLAKTINCRQPQNGEPCNTCTLCQEISQGRSLDVIEIDAASNRGVDEIRDLREKAGFSPSQGRYKIYIIDEVHMLTNEAFNALLKTLEEPPPHVIFVLATTEAHRLPATVVSRCQRHDFRRIGYRQLVNHLLYVADQEHLLLSRAAAELIARSATGSLRDALSLLDQAMAYAGQTIELETVQAMLGVTNPETIRALITSILENRPAGGLRIINELTENGADLRQLTNQITGYCRALLLAQHQADLAAILDLTAEAIAEITELARRFTPGELLAITRIFSQTELAMKSQIQPQLPLELALIECMQLRQQGQQARPLQVVAPEHSEKASNAEEGPDSDDVVALAGPTTPVTSPDSEVSQPSQATLSRQQLLSRWEEVLQAVRERSISVRGLLHPYTCQPQGIEGDTVVLGFPFKFHQEKTQEAKNRAVVEEAFKSVFGHPYRLKCIQIDRTGEEGGRGRTGGGNPGSGALSGGKNGPSGSNFTSAGSSSSAESAPEPKNAAAQAIAEEKGVPAAAGIEGVRHIAQQDVVVREMMAVFDAQIVPIRLES